MAEPPLAVVQVQGAKETVESQNGNIGDSNSNSNSNSNPIIGADCAFKLADATSKEIIDNKSFIVQSHGEYLAANKKKQQVMGVQRGKSGPNLIPNNKGSSNRFSILATEKEGVDIFPRKIIFGKEGGLVDLGKIIPFNEGSSSGPQGPKKDYKKRARRDTDNMKSGSTKNVTKQLQHIPLTSGPTTSKSVGPTKSGVVGNPRLNISEPNKELSTLKMKQVVGAQHQFVDAMEESTLGLNKNNHPMGLNRPDMVVINTLADPTATALIQQDNDRPHHHNNLTETEEGGMDFMQDGTTWNVRGAVHKDGRRNTRQLIRKHQPTLVFLMETHCPFARAARFWESMGYVQCAIAEASGHAGGLWILQNKNCPLDITVVDIYFQVITISIKHGSRKWYCSAIYASPQAARRDLLWPYMSSLRQRFHDPWLLMGDFNEILLPSEVRDGDFLENRALKFASTLQVCNLMDLGATGSLFTWYRKERGVYTVAKRLDRALGDCNWRHMFPEAYVENLVRLHSDHRPILLRLSSSIPDRSARPFRFQAAWLTHKQFPSVVKNAWDRGDHEVPASLDQVRIDAQEFNKEVFGNIFAKKRELESQLRDVQRKLDQVDSACLTIQEATLQKEYNDVLKQEEILWYQKSREKWVKMGDRNTKFFHTQTVVRRKRNKIQGLFLSDGSWCTDGDRLQAEATSYYQELFSVDPSTTPNSMHVHLLPQLSDLGSDMLVNSVTKEEVKAAMFSMKSYKAPGPDGFQPLFFKHFWGVVGDDIWQLVKRAFSSGCIEANLAETLLVLIPKENNPTSLRNYRPISLCNVAFKVVTKVLVSRLRPFLDDLVGPLQSSFIPKRGTSDNAILAQEVIHYMHHSRARKKGTIAFKIDLEKAYDRLNWDFLEITLREFKFPDITINLIMSCVRSSNLAILWNGGKTKNFRPTRGLRQGDPLSPYLFVLCMEKLALSIQHHVQTGAWKPVHVSRGGPGISHLLFADDVLLFCEASEDQVQLVMDTLDEFCMASGLKVNLMKSKAMCSSGVPIERKQKIKDISSIRLVTNLGSYLGFPLIQGRPKKETYYNILDKMQHRMASWKGNLLNKAGRACLAKSVTSAMPIYTMQTQYLPNHICDRIDKMTRSFVWGGNGTSRSWNLVKWDTVTMPRNHGGLGIRDTRLTNLALLGKLIWSILHERDKLWVQVLLHKYVGPNSFWAVGKTNGASITWSSVQKAAKELCDGFTFKMGSGNTSIWFQDWLKVGPLCSLLDYVHISDSQLLIRDIWAPGSWDLTRLATPLPGNIVELLSNAPSPTILNSLVEDCWVWNGGREGRYSSASAYNWLLKRNRLLDDTNSWAWIWRLPAPAKVQFLVWQCLHNALPTNAMRHRRGMANSDLCPRCSAHVEDLLHCLRDCAHSRELWMRLGLFHCPGFLNITDPSTWITHMAHGEKSIIFLAGFWWAWRWRNNFIFADDRWKIDEVIRKAHISHDEFAIFCKGTHDDRILVHWQPPPEGVIKINTDGSYLIDSSSIGSGGLARDSLGQWLCGFSSYDGQGDVLLAELCGIKHGLHLALLRGYDRVLCESDSLEAIKIIKDRQSHKFHAYAGLLFDITSLLDKDWEVQLAHTPREANYCADYLAKEGSHSDEAFKIWLHPPPGLGSKLLRDSPGESP